MVELHKHIHSYGSKEDEFIVGAISDFHAGNKGLDKTTLKRSIEWISHNADAVYLGGDYADAIGPKDKRWDWRSLDRDIATPKEQYYWVEDQLQPLAGMEMWMVRGNHDETISAGNNNHDYVETMAENLGAKYLMDSGYIRLSMRRDRHYSVFNMYCHHGKSGARTRGGRLNKVESMAKIFEADIHLMSHVHDALNSRNQVLMVDRSMNIIEKKTYYAITGGFLKGYVEGNSSYVERGMYAPSSIGGIFLRLHCEKNLRNNVMIWDIPV